MKQIKNFNKLLNSLNERYKHFLFNEFNVQFDENELIYNYLLLIKHCLTDTLRSNGNKKEGLIWPEYAETMIGVKRINNLHYCLTDVIKNEIKGDFIETGVWRGGAVIFMRAVLKAYNIKDRNVWVADSFDGLPTPNTELYPEDSDSVLHKMKELKISIDDVKNNFKRYNLLDDQVKFLKGWFKDTLPTAPIEKLAILRLDGDMYESTMDSLINLYPKLTKGGYIIIDDYGLINACRKAVNNYREKNNISEKIELIDHTGVYWQKLS